MGPLQACHASSYFFPCKSSYYFRYLNCCHILYFNATDLKFGSSTYFILLYSFLVHTKCQWRDQVMFKPSFNNNKTSLAVNFLVWPYVSIGRGFLTSRSLESFTKGSQFCLFSCCCCCCCCCLHLPTSSLQAPSTSFRMLAFLFCFSFGSVKAG